MAVTQGAQGNAGVNAGLSEAGAARASAGLSANAILVRNTSPAGVDVASLNADLAAIAADDNALAASLRIEIESELTPVERGQFASAAFSGPAGGTALEVAHAAVPGQAQQDGGIDPELVADLVQMTLDLTGIVEPTPFSDGTNAIISVGRAIGDAFSGDGWGALGHLGNGVVSGVSILPYLGDAAKVAKIGKWAQTVSDAVSAIARNPAMRTTLEPALREIADLVNRIPQGMIDSLPQGARESLERMKGELDEFFGAGARATDARPRIELEGGSLGNWSRELNAPTLRSNTDYVVNGYTYRTNANGQVTQVEGRLDLQTADRNGYQQSVAGRGDRLETDQGGHLIASIFNGPGERVNLVPMDGNLNMGRWRSLEDTLATALREGRTVDVNINVRYPEGSARPDAFRIEYTIDGNTQVQTFRNSPGGS